MDVRTLYEGLDRLFPFGDAAVWDRVGLQVGDWSSPIGQVAVVHEITDTVADRVSERGVGTVVTYHPLFFSPVSTLIGGPTSEGRALKLASTGVSVISVHTAFDVATPGTADAFLTVLELDGTATFAPVDDESGFAIGRIAAFDAPRSVGEVASDIERATGSMTRVNAPVDRSIASLGVVPGSGGSFLAEAVGVVDAVVTGDVSHHEAQAARSAGLVVIDAGHIPTERPGVEALYAAVCTVVSDAIHITDNPNPWED